LQRVKLSKIIFNHKLKRSRQKILWQTHESNVSGANIAMLEYIDALENDFCFFVILPHKGTMQLELEKRNIPFRIIHQYGWTNVYPWWNIGKLTRVIFRSFVAISHTVKLIKVEKPSIVSTNTLVPFTASIAAWYKNTPHVWWIHEFGKEDFGFTTGWGNERMSFKWMQLSSKLIIGNSKAISNKFAKLMPKANVATIYQPVSWKATQTVKNAKLARFLMFGQLTPSKGHIDVLKAMVTNRQKGKPLNSLHIKGPSEINSYLVELQQFISQHKLEPYVQIETGYFKKEEIMPHYEILIVASQAEAFGRVIVEANKAGLCVLVRNTGGAPELINESNGLLFATQIELEVALCSEETFPNTDIRINYNEATEIKAVKELLKTACK
jgi:glycosyltransferase involved in cell wall biosynthesis